MHESKSEDVSPNCRNEIRPDPDRFEVEATWAEERRFERFNQFVRALLRTAKAVPVPQLGIIAVAAVSIVLALRATADTQFASGLGTSWTGAVSLVAILRATSITKGPPHEKSRRGRSRGRP